MESTYYTLGSKNNFNKALRHFFKVSDIVDEIESKKNLADLINDITEDDEVHEDQKLPIVAAVIRDKFQYSYSSYSIPATMSEYVKIADESSKWTAVDIVMVYYDPNGKVILLNPKNPSHWERVRELHHDQLLVIYAKHLKGGDKKIELEAIQAMKEMIAGKDVFTNKEFIDTTIMPQKHVPKKTAPAQQLNKKNMTPKYGVQVSNELFHNGNVEAWKKIIESYLTKFSDLDVHVYFKNEVINDINSLFKWGKVKHGDHIMIQVSGENIRGVSKLQKYLYEGASPRFEQFLKIGVGQVLNLF
ncbi:MAG TPA: hypothetical protein PK926_11310 [Spirochaetota bacterium]|nr:hypothetical protein [Spirochaetota bacterium]HPI88290.1 hypothetical protein [Spirochaetota bacterium]HPR47754.1 hypothetical protein [Spirochaetota bacterium]